MISYTSKELMNELFVLEKIYSREAEASKTNKDRMHYLGRAGGVVDAIVRLDIHIRSIIHGCAVEIRSFTDVEDEYR